MKRVLVVDDDEQICKVVQASLSRFGYDVMCVGDAETAASRITSFAPDLVVLDIMLPGQSGMEFCQQLRRTENVPIIFVSGLDTDTDRIVGLEIGADDYLTKPFHPGELLARVKAVLRRASATAAQPPAMNAAVLEYGTAKIDIDRRFAFIADVLVDPELTKIEFDLLKTLMRHPTRAYNRDELIEGAWGPGVYVAWRTVNSHIRRLRLKLKAAGHDPVETVRGIGYRIATVMG